jgi:hypothetical protein
MRYEDPGIESTAMATELLEEVKHVIRFIGQFLSPDIPTSDPVDSSGNCTRVIARRCKSYTTFFNDGTTIGKVSLDNATPVLWREIE